MGLEPTTSPLPRVCSTTELRWQDRFRPERLRRPGVADGLLASRQPSACCEIGTGRTGTDEKPPRGRDGPRSVASRIPRARGSTRSSCESRLGVDPPGRGRGPRPSDPTGRRAAGPGRWPPSGPRRQHLARRSRSASGPGRSGSVRVGPARRRSPRGSRGIRSRDCGPGFRGPLRARRGSPTGPRP